MGKGNVMEQVTEFKFMVTGSVDKHSRWEIKKFERLIDANAYVKKLNMDLLNCHDFITYMNDDEDTTKDELKTYHGDLEISLKDKYGKNVFNENPIDFKTPLDDLPKYIVSIINDREDRSQVGNNI